jgi:hypothetical protein
MDRSAIEKIEDLHDKAAGVLDIDGRKYVRGDLTLVSSKIPVQSAIDIHSLAGIVDYLETNMDGIDKNKCMIVAINHKKVMLVGPNITDLGRRPVYLVAEPDTEIKGFEFDKFIPFESFMIKLLCLFEDNPDLREFVKVVSKIKSSDEEKHEDNGVSTTRTTKEGVNTITESSREVVDLRPYRTFRDITQPNSKFIFRIKRDRLELLCALFECDGQNIKAFFVEKALGIPVIA